MEKWQKMNAQRNLSTSCLVKNSSVVRPWADRAKLHDDLDLFGNARITSDRSEISAVACKQNKQIMLENEWNDIKRQFPVTLLNCLLLKILVVHCKWKAFDICCALCILRLIISFVPVSRQNFRSQTKKYSSNDCTVDFKRD